MIKMNKKPLTKKEVIDIFKSVKINKKNIETVIIKNLNKRIVAKNIISSKGIQIVRKSINVVLEKILKLRKFNKKISEKNVHAEMILLRKKRPDLFSEFFNTLQTSSSIYLALSNIKILNTVSRLLRINNHEITLTDITIRLDPPNDYKNTVDWHQDSSYFKQNNSGKNGLAVWAPLFKIKKNMGPLQYLRSSHNLGSLNVAKKKKLGKFISGKREISSKNLKKFNEILEFNVNVGDALLMNLDMIHRSGNNFNNKKVRVTMIGRFHNMLSRDFNSGASIYNYSDKKFNFDVHGF